MGTVSPRKIERACYEDLAFRVLTGNQQPDHSRICDFRRRNLDALKGLFVQIWGSPDFVDTVQGFTWMIVRAVMNACS